MKRLTIFSPALLVLAAMLLSSNLYAQGTVASPVMKSTPLFRPPTDEFQDFPEEGPFEAVWVRGENHYAKTSAGGYRRLIMGDKFSVAWNSNGEISLLDGGPAIDASSIVSAHLARDYFEKWIESSPSDRDRYVAWTGLGLFQQNAGELDSASASLKQALELSPDAAIAHVNLASLHLATKDLSNALREAEIAVSKDPSNENAFYVRALTHFRMKSGKLAEEDTEKAIELNPRDGRPRILLSDIYVFLLQDESKAISATEESLRVSPDNLQQLNVACWLRATAAGPPLRNPQKAIKFGEKACELTDYMNPEFLDSLSAAYASAGDFAKAIELVSDAIAMSSKDSKSGFEKHRELYTQERAIPSPF